VAHDVAEAAADPGAEAGHIAFGLAGLQAKFSMSRGKDRSLVMRGSRGAEAWIVKTPDAVYPGVAENEYFVSRWARAAGIDVPDVNLVPSTDLVGLPPHVPLHDKLAFAIRRFDREDHARIHQEDFAQVIGRPLGHGGKYTGTSFDALAHVVLVHCGMADWEQYIRRLVFMVACGNADAHLKNWSLRYLNGVDARLSPAYDLLSTVVYPGHEHEAMALLLNKHSGFTQVSDRSWCRIARLCGMDERQVERQARTSAGAVRAAWRSTVDALAASLALPDRFVERVEKHMARIPLLRGV
ncbi:MAG: HipA domain-containing protein, partial [Deltaproteobacteria bacterium]|nr:HipA domain-containing protein [Deltaproteobacteria bacterium]